MQEIGAWGVVNNLVVLFVGSATYPHVTDRAPTQPQFPAKARTNRRGKAVRHNSLSLSSIASLSIASKRTGTGFGW